MPFHATNFINKMKKGLREAKKIIRSKKTDKPIVVIKDEELNDTNAYIKEKEVTNAFKDDRKQDNPILVNQDYETLNNISKVVPTHEEAVANAVKEAKKHLKGYLDN